MSYGIPPVLGQARRDQAAAERAAAGVSPRSVTDNPVYVPPDGERPLGTVFVTGGFTTPGAQAALDGLAFAWADLCQLAQPLRQHPATADELIAPSGR